MISRGKRVRPPKASMSLRRPAVAQYTPFNDIDLSLRAFYKRVFRMPTLNDLYYTFIGNKYLKPEYTTQYNVGLAYSKEWPSSHFRRLDASVDAYDNQVLKTRLSPIPPPTVSVDDGQSGVCRNPRSGCDRERRNAFLESSGPIAA